MRSSNGHPTATDDDEVTVELDELIAGRPTAELLGLALLAPILLGIGCAIAAPLFGFALRGFTWGAGW